MARKTKKAERKPAPRRGVKRVESSAGPVTRYVVTTVRLSAAQYEWVRRTALDRALEHGGKADASAILRELVEAAMA